MGKVTEVNVVTGKQTTRDMTESEEKNISSPAPSESAQLDALRYERNMLLIYCRIYQVRISCLIEILSSSFHL